MAISGQTSLQLAPWPLTLDHVDLPAKALAVIAVAAAVWIAGRLSSMQATVGCQGGRVTPRLSAGGFGRSAPVTALFCERCSKAIF
jgi:hypothetical protein